MTTQHTGNVLKNNGYRVFNKKRLNLEKYGKRSELFSKIWHPMMTKLVKTENLTETLTGRETPLRIGKLEITDMKTEIGQREAEIFHKAGKLAILPVTTKISNTTDYVLKPAEESVLLRGLKFCPTPKNNDPLIDAKDIKEFCRRIQLTEFLQIKNHTPTLWKKKSCFKPPSGRNEFMDNAISTLQKTQTRLRKKSVHSNISYEASEAIKFLSFNENLVIKEVDEGAAIVIMKVEYYVEKIENILRDSNAYEALDMNEDKKVVNKITKFVANHQEELTNEEIHYLTKFEWKTSNFYGLPKIHKSKQVNETIQKKPMSVVQVINPSDLKFRPIVAGPTNPTPRLSHFIDLILQPLKSKVAARFRCAEKIAS